MTHPTRTYTVLAEGKPIVTVDAVWPSQALNAALKVSNELKAADC